MKKEHIEEKEHREMAQIFTEVDVIPLYFSMGAYFVHPNRQEGSMVLELGMGRGTRGSAWTLESTGEHVR